MVSKSFPYSLISSAYDFKTEETDPSFLSVAPKSTHHQTYTKFLQHTKTQKHIFAKYKHTSSFTMTNLYRTDLSRIPRYLHNHDPIKQYFCLLPHNDTSRPRIVTQEYLVHTVDFLLPCNIPTQIVKPLTVTKHVVSSPLDDKDTSYYAVLSKQSHFYNELFFNSAKVISSMLQTENKSEYRPPPIERTSPIRNTAKKLSSILNNRTLRDITQLLDT